MNKTITRTAIHSWLLFSALSASSALSAQIPVSEYAARRAALAERLQNGILVALGSPEPEQDYITFNQNSNFKYLTGFNEPEAALVMVIRNGAIVGTPMLFVQPSDPAREVWSGYRLGVARVRTTFGLEGRTAQSLMQVVDTLLSRDTMATLHTVGNFNPQGPLITRDDQMIGGMIKGVTRAHTRTRVNQANGEVNNLRRIKSAAELDLLRRAISITVGAHRDAMRVMEPRLNEFEVQSLVEYNFRRNGADRPSFSSIIGSGPNSTTLHYNANDRFIEQNDVIVMDIGASYRGYAADVTRTVPASGTFSPAQREIYQIVRDAQAAAERQAKVNAPARPLTDSSNVVIAAGLARLGLIDSPNGTYDCDTTGSTQCQQYRLYYMHGLGHGIGLDVHDPGSATGGGNLVPGSAFTIEPGIYVRGNLLDIIPATQRNQALIAKIRPSVQKYANIGVRIEDDYFVTPSGVEWISRAPREIAEIEALMKEPYTGPSPRDPATVEAYRSTGRRAP